LATAIRLYQDAPGRDRSYGCLALAHAQLAAARLMSNRVDVAAEAIADVLTLDPGRRISSLHPHVQACRELLKRRAARAPDTAVRALGYEYRAISNGPIRQPPAPSSSV